MASELKSYVEKFLLNPAASFNVDDEGNEETNAQITETLADEERAAGHLQSKSKLRARNDATAVDSDPRYSGKKVTRKDLLKDIEYDPELTNFFIDDDGEDEESKEEGDGDEDEENEEEGEGDENETRDDEESVDYEQDLKDYQVEDDMNTTNEGGFVFDGDFSRFEEDFEEEGGDSEDESEDGDEEEEEDDDDANDSQELEDTDLQKDSQKEPLTSIKRFQSSDEFEEIQKSRCVKEQLGLYDSLFEFRIGLQKCTSSANQLPQHNAYKAFVRERDPNYIQNLTLAKSVTKKLLNTLLEVQLLMGNQNPDTRKIFSEKRERENSDEEITSEEDESEELQPKGKKRKLKLEEYDSILAKRHASLVPFRDETLTRWYEKTKLLTSKRGKDKFAGFEVSAVQQLYNVLNSKPSLIRRTQLTGVMRGTNYHILGRANEDSSDVNKEEYDPEIFDDADFYSKSLEDMLKSKMSLSTDMADVSRRWIAIQKLRKKVKRRKVDTKASKGRKLRFDVMSKLQQYLAPCNPPQMDDGAINTLFASLFGKGMQVSQPGSG